MNDTPTTEALFSSTVYDESGSKVGSVTQVYTDDLSRQPSWISVSAGLFSSKDTLVPLARAQVSGTEIRVPYAKSFIKNAPKLHADKHLEPEGEKQLYDYYGQTYQSDPRAVGGPPQPYGQPDSASTGQYGGPPDGASTGQYGAPPAAYPQQPGQHDAAQQPMGQHSEPGFAPPQPPQEQASSWPQSPAEQGPPWPPPPDEQAWAAPEPQYGQQPPQASGANAPNEHAEWPPPANEQTAPPQYGQPGPRPDHD